MVAVANWHLWPTPYRTPPGTSVHWRQGCAEPLAKAVQSQAEIALGEAPQLGRPTRRPKSRGTLPRYHRSIRTLPDFLSNDGRGTRLDRLMRALGWIALRRPPTGCSRCRGMRCKATRITYLRQVAGAVFRCRQPSVARSRGAFGRVSWVVLRLKTGTNEGKPASPVRSLLSQLPHHFPLPKNSRTVASMISRSATV
jgi:hypothetical protein